MNVKDLAAEIRKLSEEERRELDQELMGPVIHLSPEEEKEIERRIQALREGRVKTIPLAEVIAETLPAE